MKERIIEVMNTLAEGKASGFNNKDLVWETKYELYIFSPSLITEDWIFMSDHDSLYINNDNRLDIEIL